MQHADIKVKQNIYIISNLCDPDPEPIQMAINKIFFICLQKSSFKYLAHAPLVDPRSQRPTTLAPGQIFRLSTDELYQDIFCCNVEGT